jgi:hypothetical protein
VSASSPALCPHGLYDWMCQKCKPTPLRFTNHAVKQLRERWGLRVDHGFYELQEALRQHRHSPRTPAAFVRYSETRPGRTKIAKRRYAWDENEARCYVLRGMRFPPSGGVGKYADGWVVITVVPARGKP